MTERAAQLNQAVQKLVAEHVRATTATLERKLRTKTSQMESWKGKALESRGRVVELEKRLASALRANSTLRIDLIHATAQLDARPAPRTPDKENPIIP